jgi:hypothetical protein
MRYTIFAGAQLVALISFCASAWKLAPRERFVGWDTLQRPRNLQLIVNNTRFLILPWIQSKGLASKILSLLARQLPIETSGKPLDAATSPASTIRSSPSRTSGSIRYARTSARSSAGNIAPRVHRIFTGRCVEPRCSA